MPPLSPEDAWLADLLRDEASVASAEALDAETLKALRHEVNALRAVLHDATATPDNPWLWRYFAEQARIEPVPSSPLTPPERRWVKLLLTHHPDWQKHWQSLEEDIGESVPMGLEVMQRAPDRPAHAAQPQARVYVWRRFLVAAVVVIGLYGVLWGVSQATTPVTHTLASLDPYASDLAVLTAPVRSANTSSTDPTQSLAQGLNALQAAPTSTLGLFPQHDPAHVQDALAHLNQAYTETDDPILNVTAAFFIAKAHLMLGDVEAARSHLQDVAQRNTVYSDDAQALLAEIVTP